VYTPSLQLLVDSPSVGGWLPLEDPKHKDESHLGAIRVVMNVRCVTNISPSF